MHSTLREFKANIFAALAHPTRIAIVDELRAGEVTAGDLADRLEVQQANLSQHLTVLRDRELVIRRKVRNQVYYSLRDPVLLQVLDVLKRYFNARLRRSAGTLEELWPRRERRE